MYLVLYVEDAEHYSNYLYRYIMWVETWDNRANKLCCKCHNLDFNDFHKLHASTSAVSRECCQTLDVATNFLFDLRHIMYIKL